MLQIIKLGRLNQQIFYIFLENQLKQLLDIYIFSFLTSEKCVNLLQTQLTDSHLD